MEKQDKMVSRDKTHPSHKHNQDHVSEIAPQVHLVPPDLQEIKVRKDIPESKENQELQAKQDPRDHQENKDHKDLQDCLDALVIKEKQESTCQESHPQDLQEDKERWVHLDRQDLQERKVNPVSLDLKGLQEIKAILDLMENLERLDRWDHQVPQEPMEHAIIVPSQEHHLDIKRGRISRNLPKSQMLVYSIDFVISVAQVLLAICIFLISFSTHSRASVHSYYLQNNLFRYFSAKSST